MASLVEGHGEVEALPVLIRRIAESVGFAGDLGVNPPYESSRVLFSTTKITFANMLRSRPGKR
jgi:hypothetical protein